MLRQGMDKEANINIYIYIFKEGKLRQRREKKEINGFMRYN